MKTDVENFKGIGKTRYNIDEAAEELGVSSSAVYIWIRKGLVPYLDFMGRKYITSENLKKLKETIQTQNGGRKVLKKKI